MLARCTALLALLLAVSGCASEPRWHRVVAEDGSFSIEMPNQPRQSVQQADSAHGKIDAHFMTAVHGGVTYSLLWADYPPAALTTASDVLDHAVVGALQNTGAERLEEHEIEFAGFAGRDLRARQTAALLLRIRLLLVGGRLYQLTVAGPPRPQIDARTTRCFESFDPAPRGEMDLRPTPR